MSANAQLNKDPLRKCLHQCRLLSYASLSKLGQNTFGRLRYIQHVLELYEHIFGEPATNPIHLGSWDVFPVEEDIVWRLQKCFPLDIDVLNQQYQFENPDPLAGTIPIEAFGIDVYEQHFDYVRVSAQPLVALLAEQLYPPPWGNWDWSDALERTREWWPDDAPPREGFTWVEECDAPQELLARLDPPLDGLSIEYRCIVRDDDDNIFLRHAPHGAWDVLVEEELFWHPDAIDRLADEWDETRPDIERLDAYHDWFDDQDEPVMSVINAFQRVEELYLER